MAINPFEENSAIALQLATDISSQVKSQISSFGGLSGALAQSAKGVQGDVTRAISQMTQASEGAVSIASSMANKLEASGIADKIKSDFMSHNLTSSIMYKTNIASYIPKNPVNITDIQNRLPDIMKKLPVEKMQEAKDRLLGELDLNYAGYVFPLDLLDDSYAHTYLRLSFQPYQRTSAYTPGNLGTPANVSLPIPENYNENFQIDYEQRDIQLLGATEQSIQDGLSEQEAKALAMEYGVKGGITKIAELFGQSDVTDMAYAIRGAIQNPHPTLFFKGIRLRSFEWNWKLVPRSAKEAENIKNIIRLIKKRVLPSKNGSTALQYPNFVTPSFVGKGANEMGNFKKCLVNSLSINYTAEGTSAFFHDGKPVSIQMNMGFTEFEQYVSEDVQSDGVE